MNLTQLKRKLLKQIEFGDEETTHGISYPIFTNTPNTLFLRETDKGKRIWLCGYPRTKKFYLKGFKENQLIVRKRGGDHNIFLFKKEAILHPSEWTKERINESI